MPLNSLDIAARPHMPGHVSGKFGSLELARGIAALLVVLDHAGYLVAQDRFFGRQAFGGLLLNFHVGVDFFFVLSGFIISMVHWGDGGRPERLPRYARRRFLRIFPTYWIVLSFVATTYLLQPGFGFDYQHHWLNIATSYILFPMPDQPVLGVAWTLVFEATFYLIFAAYIAIGRSVLWLLVPSATLILVTAVTGAGGYPLDFLASPYHLEFATGILVAGLLRSQPQPQRGPAFLLAAAGLSVFLVAAIWTSPDSILETPLIGRFVFGISAAAIILGCTRLETIGAIRIGPRLQVLGAMSYAVYLTHVVTESFSMRFVMKLPASLASPETGAVIISLAGVAGGWLFWRFVERPLLDRLQQRRSGRLQPATR